VRRRILLAGLALAAALPVAACGDDERARPAAATSAAPPLSAGVRVTGTIPRVRPADFRAPTAAYRRHVRRTLRAMLRDLDRLRAAAAAGDLRGARAAWLAADERYEEIGAAYGAFGALDAAINGRGAGLHRVERALWARRSARAAVAPTARLRADVRRLHDRVGHMTIDPLEYALRAHEVLEDTLHLRLTGQTSPYSGAALVALRGNLRGTRVVLDSLRPLLVRRNPAVVVRADRALRELDGALAAAAGPRGALPRWDALGLRERERLAGLTALAAERLAFVPEIVDPRPPRAPQSAFGQPEAR
jgi:high-affinity iron transporter